MTGGARTGFGQAVNELVGKGGREPFWSAALAAIDSDADGRTNGEELQDPEGTWEKGMKDPGDPMLVTNPSVADVAADERVEDEEIEDEAEATGRTKLPELEVDVSSRLRYDSDDIGSDFDGRAFTQITIRDMIEDHLDMRISGWGLWDLNSEDAYDEVLDGDSAQLSEAYLDLHDVGPFAHLRLGRQYLYDIDQLHFDGALWSTKKQRPWSFFLFGGKPVEYYYDYDYDYDYDDNGDWLSGGGVVWKPSWRARHQVDMYYSEEEDEGFFAAAWRWNQYWPKGWRTNTTLRFLDDDVRDFRVLATKYLERLGIGLQVDYTLQPKVRGRGDEGRSRTFSSYVNLLGPRAENHRIGVNLNKFFSDKLLFQVGGSVRRGRGSLAEDTFNSAESEHFHVSVTRFNAWDKPLDVTLAFESIKTEDDTFKSFTGHATYRPNPKWDYTLGASLSRYKLDPIDFPTNLNGPEEVDLFLDDIDSFSPFFEVNWRPTGNLKLRGEVSWEDTDASDEDAFTATLGFNYHFHTYLGWDTGFEEIPDLRD